MFKGLFFIILGLNILIFSIFVSYKTINKLNNKNNIFNYEKKDINYYNQDNNQGNNKFIYDYPIIDALTVVSEYNYYSIKDLLDQWENDVKVYEPSSNKILYSVLAFPNNTKDINKFISKLNSLGLEAKLDYDNINLGLFKNKNEAEKLKQKAISYGIDAGIMKIYENNQLSLDENKYIIYFKRIDYLDFYEIVKMLESFSVLEPIRFIN